jgi:lipopolysaccharide export system permease protein
MKILDRYILKQFILTTLFGLLAFTAIFVIIDLMEKLDDFLDRDVSSMIILQYYIAFIPEIIKLMTPMAILLSSLFTTGRLSNTNELTAMKSSGLSLYRYMLPLLIVGFITSLGFVYFNGWVVPYANQKKFHIERVYLDRNIESSARTDIYVQDSPTRIASILFFDGRTKTGSRISVQVFADSNLISIVRRYDARQFRWDSTTSSWILTDVTIRTWNGNSERMETVPVLSLSDLHFHPEDIIKKIEKPDEMNYWELSDFIERQIRSGNDVSRWRVEYYSKISFPFASFIVVLFGVPFSFGRRRRGLAIQFGISVAICFIYLVFMKISQVFGYNGDLHPLLTAWLANLIFLVGGLLNIVRVGK